VADRRRGLRGWIDDLRGDTSEPPAHAGAPCTQSLGRSLQQAQLAAVDALCQVGSGSVVPALNSFGRDVVAVRDTDAASALAEARGLSLSGLRTAVHAPDTALGRLAPQLRVAADTHLPLVLWAGFDWIEESGAFLLHPVTPQATVDAVLVAHDVAERALMPGAIAVDSTDLRRLVTLRSAEIDLVRRLPGSSHEEIEAPTPAQALVFGAHRRRHPRWLDPERPAAHGTVPTVGPEGEAAIAGRRVFFAAALAELAEAARADFSALTGRDLAPLVRFGPDNARRVLVTHGPMTQTAAAVAEVLASKGESVAVIGIQWLQPFPRQALEQLLSGVDSICVLERVGQLATSVTGATDPPLLRQVRACLGASSARLLSATCGRLDEALAAAVITNLQSTAPRAAVHLGIAAPGRSDFPRRQVLLDRLRRDHPELEQLVLPPAAMVKLTPAAATAVALQVRQSSPPEDLLDKLAAMMAASDAETRGDMVEREPGLWHVRVAATAANWPQGADLPPASMLLVDGIDPSISRDPFADLAAEAIVVVRTEAPGEAVWQALPAAWRLPWAARGLRLLVSPTPFEELLSGLTVLLANAAESLPGEVDWRSLPGPPPPADETRVPELLRRWSNAATTFDSVSRFWGEFEEPRLHGEQRDTPVPDPHLALGAVPACTAAFYDMGGHRERVPQLDPEACTGCSRCWTSCPDSALAAVALPTQALLEAAAERAAEADAGPTDPAWSVLRRSLRQVATRIDGQLAESSAKALTQALLRDACEWVLQRLKVDGDEEQSRQSLRELFSVLADQVDLLKPVATAPLFHEAHGQQKGSGQLLLLAVSPQACQGCGVCGAVCPEGALGQVAQTATRLDTMRHAWRMWETLPDTTGATIASAAADPRVGHLGAILMSRYSLTSVTGGDGAEPGSGARLAVRQMAAVIEYDKQRRWMAFAAQLEELTQQLRSDVTDALSGKLAAGDLGAVNEALLQGDGASVSLAQVLTRLEAGGGTSGGVDVSHVRALAEAATHVEGLHQRLLQAAGGEGRARFELIVDRQPGLEWATDLGRNPFSVPLAVGDGAEAARLATGAARALRVSRQSEAQALRHIRQLLDDSTEVDTPLTAEERGLCPPVVLLTTAAGLAGLTSHLSEALAGELHVLVLVLDDLAGVTRNAGAVDLLPQVLAHPRAHSLSTSVAYPEHFFNGVSAALASHSGAIIHLYAPSPRQHGFATDRTVARAAAAVHGRMAPLLHYDPQAPGLLGTRLNLQGNPAPEGLCVADEISAQLQTPLHWALGETRWQADFITDAGGIDLSGWLAAATEDRGASPVQLDVDGAGRTVVAGRLLAGAAAALTRWEMLQELAGVVTPFAEAAVAQADAALRIEHETALAAQQTQFEQQLAAAEGERLSVYRSRLRDRLLQLAGYRRGR
jgi:pyruvate-ferredoxin/flavodoxin oxidoreductase